MILTHLTLFEFVPGATAADAPVIVATKRRPAGRPSRRRRWILLDEDRREEQEAEIAAQVANAVEKLVVKRLPVDVILSLSELSETKSIEKRSNKSRTRQKAAFMLLIGAL